ncbi:Bug family tripartite tricarboxylate transporter substrate binding protein [Roseococcus pinisoli]|uniref:Tripartite tricarboxylate transporter substrate binding protein n=1 Tax=Roseococcus pinisoli TaxID=2835040 RepID=A0ABS5QAE5_9PROT|nr:tripartite tricarboxylate transporter substrate binding protein [Roseococcus pinisoli]MBS7809915.1 tripartite tricarboxylate transporter substrate binding protein [Roseococcus pinisoli]
MLPRRNLLRTGAAMAAALPVAAQAQGFPDRSLRWVVGYPPGGASDTFARLIGASLATRLGQSVVVENRPGGGAVLASEIVARSAPDGYTWLHVDNGILTYNPALYSRLPYNPDTDLTGIGFIGRFPLYIVVRTENAPTDFAGLLAASRQKSITYGTPAVASPHHLAMELVRRRTQIDVTHVPYRGGPAAMQDLLAGQVDCVVIDTATGLPFIRDGKVRALAVLTEARTPGAPEVPTMAELGYPNTVAYGWQGMSVPSATPAPIVARLSAAMIEAIQSPEITSRMRGLGVDYQPWTPVQFAEFVAAENALWRPLIRELGIRLDG